MRTLLTLTIALVAVTAARAGAPAAGTTVDPSGIWTGQLTSVGSNIGWHTTMTLVCDGTEVCGAFEWIALDSQGQTFTTFAGTWDPAARRLRLQEGVLFEELVPGHFTVTGSYTIEIDPADPDFATGQVGEEGSLHGGLYLARVGAIGDTSGLAARWQSLPSLKTPAVSLTLRAGEGDALVGTGAFLDRDTRALRRVTVHGRRDAADASRWQLESEVDGAAESHTAELDRSGCLMRLTSSGGPTVVFVRRGPASEGADERE